MQNVVTKNQSTGKEKIQKFGNFLSSMVIPNIGAFIAWGLITALFIPTGWIPNEYFAKLVGPMITYLLPLLIGYRGGNIVYGKRGGVVGAIATAGVIVGASIPMFLGAMIMGPLGGYVIKKFDQLIDGKVPTGFEMLVNNFSAGIVGGGVSMLAYSIIEPIVSGISTGLGSAAQAITNMGALPLIAFIVEPAKILFLNNAMNHGVFSPLAIQQVQEAGKSIFFLLEPNPGVGLGILLAFMLYSRGTAKQSAPGAIIIHFLGGIHEIYFPYVLMKPALILAVIAGGLVGDFTFVATHAGLVASPSPGSIFALMAMAPKGGLLPVLAGVATSAIASFLVAAVIIKRNPESEEDLEEAQSKVKVMKAESKGQVAEKTKVLESNISLIVFACDAGMGSSAMGESILKKALKDAGITSITVQHSPVDEIPKSANVVFTQESLVERARKSASTDATIITVKNFLDRGKYDDFINGLK